MNPTVATRTAVVESINGGYRVSCYRDGALDHRIWYQTKWAADAYADAWRD